MRNFSNLLAGALLSTNLASSGAIAQNKTPQSDSIPMVTTSAILGLQTVILDKANCISINQAIPSNNSSIPTTKAGVTFYNTSSKKPEILTLRISNEIKNLCSKGNHSIFVKRIPLDDSYEHHIDEPISQGAKENTMLIPTEPPESKCTKGNTRIGGIYINGKEVSCNPPR